MTIVRYVVFGLVALVALAAFAAMAVQRRMINPFGRAARTVRDVTDPVVKPIERLLLRRGGNPQNAPWWLLGGALVTGIIVISVAQWVLEATSTMRYAAEAGPRTTIAVIAAWIIRLISLALMIRVIGSWFGAGRYTPWMKPFYFATEWLLAPLRRFIPPFGPLDVTPLVAWLILLFLGPVLVGLIAGR